MAEEWVAGYMEGSNSAHDSLSVVSRQQIYKENVILYYKIWRRCLPIHLCDDHFGSADIKLEVGDKSRTKDTVCKCY